LEHPLPRNGSSAGAKVLGLFTARERMFHGTNAPQERKSLDFSLPGTKVQRNEKPDTCTVDFDCFDSPYRYGRVLSVI